MVRLIWMAAGWTSFGAGVAGAVLPLVPTVPFMLLAAFCFARGSDRVHRWLLEHPRFGPSIRDWREHGAIGRRTKRLSVLLMLAAFTLSVALGLPGWVLAVQAAALLGAGTFVLTRPDRPEASRA
jgi:uncharacterized membrane protein YbaN (DUF454 family)